MKQINAGLLEAALALGRNTDAGVRQPQPSPAPQQLCPHPALAAQPGPMEPPAPRVRVGNVKGM